MLKQQARLLRKIAIFIDLLAIICAFTAAYHVRSQQAEIEQFRHYLWVLLAAIPIWYFLLARYGLYASLRTRKFSQIVTQLSKVHVIGGVIASSAIYFIDNKGYSRGLFSHFLFFSFLLIVTEKALLKMALSYIRVHGYNTRNVVVVGAESKARQFIDVVDKHATWGLRIIGLVEPHGDVEEMHHADYPVLGQLDGLLEICKRFAVDEVVFSLPKEYMGEVDNHLRELETMGITVRMLLNHHDTPGPAKELHLFHDEIPMITFCSKDLDAEQLFLKRCLDIVGALVGMFLTAFLIPFIAIALKLDSRGPLLFAQERVGKSGRIFLCWKFRSMYEDAEERKKELMRMNEMNGAMFKIKDDPRVTRVGRFLRKTSLDELPQFWNVLRGEMSLVGTRPPTPEEVATYENWHRKRISIKPGITGLWQVSGRNEIRDFDQVVRLDLEYIDRWSIWLDVKLLLKTAWVVFARKGSC
jgi:exopolysaccharide biosynthesis polyprenyl glycosylphosphotransferase